MDLGLTYKEYMETRFFSSLDAIRFFCIAAVLWHCSPGAESGASMAARSFLGVDMFFILSGFLMVTLLLREQETFGSLSFKDFYIKRACRVLPIYSTFLFAAITAAPFLSAEAQDSVLSLYDEGIWHRLWSLSIEEQFYLFWPFLEWKGRRIARPFIILLLISCILRDAGVLEQLGFIAKSPLSRSLAWGVALAHLLHTKRGYNIARKVLGTRYTPLFVLVLLSIVLLQAGPRESWNTVFTTVLMTAFVGAVAIQPKSSLALIFRFTPISQVYKVSKNIFLYHIPFIVLFGAFFSHLDLSEWSAGFLLLCMGLLLSVTAISEEQLERPFHIKNLK